MKILAAARHPSPGEAVAPVVRYLRDQGHAVVLIGVRNDTPATRVHGGSAAVFKSAGLEYVELRDVGYRDDVRDLPVALGESLIEEYRPDAILAGSSPDPTGRVMDIENVLVAAGARQGLRTVQLVEWWGSWFPRRKPVPASAYAVLDEITAEIVRSRGAPSSAIFVTGNPGLDGYASASVNGRQESRQVLGVADQRVLVFFGQAEIAEGSPDHLTTLGWLINALGPSDRLVFSPHPRDARHYDDIFERAGERLLATGLSSHQLLKVADVALSHYSTMAMKSVLLDRPTISFVLEDDVRHLRTAYGGFPVNPVGGAIEVRSEEELRLALASDLAGDGSRLRKALGVDGKATRRVAELVCEAGD